MLEKLAEIIREQVTGSGDATHFEFPCYACPYSPRFGPECGEEKGWCPSIETPLEIQLKLLARWAVLLVARALEKEVAEAERLANQKQMRSGAYIRLASGLMNLITEAKEAAHEA